ncbi:MAG: hypothetical protein ABI205_00450 [Gemmatimonadaceae bacterium]
MKLRRLAGWATIALLLHLNVASSDAACATQAGMASAAMAGSTPSHSMSGMAGNGGQHQQHGVAPCETPSQANCCQALVSCSAVFTINRALALAPSVARAAIPGSVIDVPLSRIIAPDPPPPKP